MKKNFFCLILVLGTLTAPSVIADDGSTAAANLGAGAGTQSSTSQGASQSKGAGVVQVDGQIMSGGMLNSKSYVIGSGGHDYDLVGANASGFVSEKSKKSKLDAAVAL